MGNHISAVSSIFEPSDFEIDRPAEEITVMFDELSEIAILPISAQFLPWHGLGSILVQKGCQRDSRHHKFPALSGGWLLGVRR